MLKTIDNKIITGIELTREELEVMAQYVYDYSGNKEEILEDLLEQYIKCRIIKLVEKNEFYYKDNRAEVIEVYNLVNALIKIWVYRKNIIK